MPARRPTTPAVLSLWALAATVVVLQACGSNGEAPAVFQGAGENDASTAPPCKNGEQGCACPTNGATTACGEIVTKNGSYVTCSMGTATCEGNAWGPCKGNTIVVKSQHATRLGGGGDDAFTPLNIPVVGNPDGGPPCVDPCDPNPNCSELTGVPGDVDAAGIYPTAEGGLSLGSGDASSGPCTQLQCYVAACNGNAAATTITGTVYDPAGQVPLYNATVYIPVDPTGVIPAFTTGLTCDQCAGAVPPNAVANTTTDTFGHFTLTGVPSGSGLVIPVVVQMGKWRREIMLDNISSCTNNVLTTNCTAPSASQCVFRLPQNQHDGYNPADGTYDHADLPQMAMVTGSADPLECVLLKAGISESEFSSWDGTNSTPTAKVHLFESNKAPGAYLDSHLGANIPSTTLWADTSPTTVLAPHYAWYDVVLDACEGSAIDKHTGTDNTVGEPYYNLINYTNAGGRAFLTHYSYVWLQYPSVKGYVSAPNNWSGLATWLASPLTGTVDTQDPLTGYVITAFPKGAAYENWLFNVGASTTLDQLIIHEGRQDLYDPNGTLPSSNTSAPTSLGTGVQPWLNANDSSETLAGKAEYVPHFTFNTPITAPAASQCGRVVFSDFHVSTNSQVGNGNPTCTESSECGFGQVCTGHPGVGGTCSEPCITNADCKDTSYSCVGVTAGQCLPTSCKSGTPTYACPSGLVCDTASHTNCLCTADSQCPSGKCINSTTQAQCTGLGPCTGSASVGLDPSTNCQSDAPLACGPICSEGLPDPSGQHCWCTANSECASGQCVPWAGGCTGPACTGTGTAQTADHCQPETAAIPATCADTSCPGGGVYFNNNCACTNDNQCAKGACVNQGQAGCTAATCSGSSPADAHSCATTAPTCTQTLSYTCPLSATMACSASHDCECTSNSQCANGLCVPNGQCTSPACTGAGAADDLGCQVPVAFPAPGLGAFSCSSGGTCDPTDQHCWCTNDNQCANGECVTWSGCSGSSCSGASGTPADAHNCATTAPSCSTTSPAACPLGGSTKCTGSGNGNCACGASSDCDGNVCGGAAGTQNDLGCQKPASFTFPSVVAGTYSCGGGGPLCNPAPNADTQCWCTNDSECGNGACVSWTGSGCTGSTCSGTGSVDTHHCAQTAPSCSGSNFTCPGDTTRSNDNVQTLGCKNSNGTEVCNDVNIHTECLASQAHPGYPSQNCAGAVDGINCCDKGPLGDAPPGVGTTCSTGETCDTNAANAGQCECTGSVCGGLSSCSNLETSNTDNLGCAARPSGDNQTQCTNAGGTWFTSGTHSICTCTSDTMCGLASACQGIKYNFGWTSCTAGSAGCSCTTAGGCTSTLGYNGTDSLQCNPRDAATCGPPDTYSCSTGTEVGGTCVCNNDNQCNSGSCANNNQAGCTSATCTGAAGQGGTDGCVTSCSGTYSCSDTKYNSSPYSGCTTASGACPGASGTAITASCTLGASTCASVGTMNFSPNPAVGGVTANTKCWCTNDDECGSLKCVCNGQANCTGTGVAPNGAGGGAGQYSTTTSCLNDAVEACSGPTYACSDTKYNSSPYTGCTTGSGACPGATGTGISNTSTCASSGYSCSNGGTPFPTSGTATKCICNHDSQCASQKCINQNGQCTGTNCTGSGTNIDANDCQIDAVTACNPPSFACTDSKFNVAPYTLCTTGSGTCPGVTTGAGLSNPTYACTTGVCNAADNNCLCTNDSQCGGPLNKCVPTTVNGTPTCASPSCTGTGTNVDGNSCEVPASLPSPGLTCPATATGLCNTAGDCVCRQDSDCGATGKCVDEGQGCAVGACHGAGLANDRDCQDPVAVPVGCTETIPYSCSSGVCNAAGTACLCTADNQCPSGQCIDSGQGCASGACSGTGTADAANCLPSAVTNCSNPPPPNGTNAQCGGPNSVELCSIAGDGGAAPGLGQCSKACTTNTQCTGGEICTAGHCTGCNSASNCYDRVYPKTCNGASGAVSGNCCGNGSPIPTTTCGTNNGLFPEECLQTPLTDQEKALEFMFFDLTSCVTPDTGTVTTPVLLTAKSFTLEFIASCASGTRPRWREFDYEASFPASATGTYVSTYPDNSIDFAAQTGGGYPNVNDAGGAFIPTTPLQLGTPATTNTLPPNWVQILLDTAPGGTGLFTTASPTIVSQVDLLMTITLTPTADQLSSPTLLAWRAEYDCPPSE